MIRWYDYLAAFFVADLMFSFVLNGGFFGGLFAYGIFMMWEDIYCFWRKNNESKR